MSRYYSRLCRPLKDPVTSCAIRTVLYNRLRENPGLSTTPRTFFFAGKAAPAYRLAKVIIKFLNNLADTIDGDPAVRGRLKVLFLPEYCVCSPSG